MKGRNPALATCALLLLGPAAGAADLPLSGITVGASVRALAQTLGPPVDVSSGDAGHRFVFPGGATAYTDDDGVVLAVDTQSGSPRIDVDGMVRTFPIGTYSGARADADLADVAEFATATLRSYRLAPRRDLVLAFAKSSNRLSHVTYGEPGQLVRLGLLPGDAAQKAVAYRAPRLRGSASNPPASGPQATVYRVSIDRAGLVRGVDVAIASSRPSSDARLAEQLTRDRYAPATLDGRPIAAAIFVEVRH